MLDGRQVGLALGLTEKRERNGGDQLWGKTKMTAELELKCRFLSKQAGE